MLNELTTSLIKMLSVNKLLTCINFCFFEQARSSSVAIHGRNLLRVCHSLNFFPVRGCSESQMTGKVRHPQIVKFHTSNILLSLSSSFLLPLWPFCWLILAGTVVMSTDLKSAHMRGQLCYQNIFAYFHTASVSFSGLHCYACVVCMCVCLRFLFCLVN